MKKVNYFICLFLPNTIVNIFLFYFVNTLFYFRFDSVNNDDIKNDLLV